MLVNGRTITFGEFFDEVYKATKTSKPLSWMDEWKNHLSEAGWEDDMDDPLANDRVEHFVEDMADAYIISLAETNHITEQHAILHSGSEFMTRLKKISLRHDIDVSEIIDRAVTIDTNSIA